MIKECLQEVFCVLHTPVPIQSSGTLVLTKTLVGNFPDRRPCTIISEKAEAIGGFI